MEANGFRAYSPWWMSWGGLPGAALVGLAPPQAIRLQAFSPEIRAPAARGAIARTGFLSPGSGHTYPVMGESTASVAGR